MVQTRSAVDIPWYNHHASERPLFNGDKLPALSLAGSLLPLPSPHSSVHSTSQDSPTANVLSFGGGAPSSAAGYPAFTQPAVGEGKSPPYTASDGAGGTQNRAVLEPSRQTEYLGPAEGYLQPPTTLASMNQAQPYMDVHPSHLSSAQPFTPQGSAAENISHYPSYQQPPLMQPGPSTYAPSHNYPQYGYPNGSPQSNNQPVTNALTPQVSGQILPLPAMTTPAPSPHAYGPNPGQPQPYVPHTYDTTGQIAPPGMKPRVTATLWEDEGSLCFQVEAKGVCVARREDNHMINGTKLLNVAGMTRGRRDGILKSEKVRHVVKIGPMHLKGVWIPFERALDFANKEKITEQLYPLFVHNIGNLLYHPTNQNRANAIVTAPERRRIEGNPPPNRPPHGSQPPPLHHHHSMQNNQNPSHMPLPSSQPPMSHSSGRPTLDRAHTFPTPPTSASSLVTMASQNGSYEWPSQPMAGNVQSSQPLSVDTGLNHTRSMPTTPATTPPGANMSSMQPYQSQPAYNDSKPYYSSAPTAQTQYASHHSIPPHNISRYGTVLTTPSSSGMEPPISRSEPPVKCEEADSSRGTNQFSLSQGNGPVNHGPAEGEAEQNHHDNEYVADTQNTYNSNRSSYGYSTSQPPLPSEHAPLPSEMAAPPPQSNGPDRVLPRSGAPSQWNPTYPPPRSGPPSSLYSVMSDTRNSSSNGNFPESYPPSSNGLSAYSSSVNGSSKRSRDDDDQDHCSRPDSRNDEPVYDHKRRKTLMDPAPTGSGVGSPINLQSVATPRRA
ncbi:hypothetical protein FQN57_002790 [Myotisia sp. PD_48]|nr:hypothetical protein FQN57_002790 [Myotisia sp. PD_48]